MKILILTACICLTISGCSTAPPANPVSLKTPPNAVNLADRSHVKQKLISQYHHWKGVKYRMGGLSRDGIDCSGFVYRTYREQLGISIPRSTENQARIGKPVSRGQLSSGDLVFFKTGFKARHVGIYVGDGRFVHASTSNGVMLSGLEDYYWRDRFWHARRLH